MDWTYFAGWLALVRCLEHQEHPSDFNLAVSTAQRLRFAQLAELTPAETCGVDRKAALCH